MDYLQFQELYHHGVKGQKWGVRNEKEYQGEDQSKNTKNKSGSNAALALAGGVVIGASAVGVAWFLKNKNDLKKIKLKNITRAQKAAATRAANKELMKSFKDVDVSISKAGQIIDNFKNVKVKIVKI